MREELIRLLKDNARITVKEIAERLAVDAAAAAAMIKKLER